LFYAGHAADVDAHQSGEKNRREKDAGNQRQYIHALVHLFGDQAK
jgi:hypothetical protein